MIESSPMESGLTTRTEKIYPLMSRKEIEGLIAQGRKIIIVDQHVLRVDAWLPYHPGGAKSIMHMIGKDATDEVNWSVLVSFCTWLLTRKAHQLTKLTY